MIDALLQALTLTTYGNEFLRNGDFGDLPEGFHELTVFKSSTLMRFERASKGLGGGTIAQTPGQWLKRLKKEDVSQLDLSLADFIEHGGPNGKGDLFTIRTEGRAGIELWTAEWSLRVRTDAKVEYKVEYVSRRGSRLMSPASSDVKLASEALFQAIGALRSELAEGSSPLWAKRLAVLETMHAQGILSLDSFPDTLPEESDSRAQLLLADAYRAWTMLSSAEFRQAEWPEERQRLILHYLTQVWRAIGAAFEAVAGLSSTRAAQAA